MLSVGVGIEEEEEEEIGEEEIGEIEEETDEMPHRGAVQPQ